MKTGIYLIQNIKNGKCYVGQSKDIDKMYENYSSEIERMQKFIDKLEQENQKYKEVFDKEMLYINSTRYSDITGLEKHSIKEFWFIEELLDILKEVE